MTDESNAGLLDDNAPAPKRAKVPETSEACRWRYRRILFRIGLGALMAPIAFYFGPNVINFGTLTPVKQSDLVRMVQENCIPIVRAVKEYHRDLGRWPDRLEDLTPKYLSSTPRELSFTAAGSWSGGAPVLRYSVYKQTIIYFFDPRTEEWHVIGSVLHGKLPLPPVTIEPGTKPAAFSD